MRQSGDREERCFSKLREKGLRLTSQRRIIARHLFAMGHRHVDAISLFNELRDEGESLALATIYNTLSEFEQCDLIRRIAVSDDKVWYDTDVGDHRHFFIKAENRIMDCPSGHLEPEAFAPPPAGYKIKSIDVVIHLEAEDE